MMIRLVLGITGASGGIYGIRLAQEVLRAGMHLSLLISRAGFLVLNEECGMDLDIDSSAGVRQRLYDYFDVDAERLVLYEEGDLLAPIASGSSAPGAMVVCPASMGTVARIACGVSSNLLERCADVMLKERRPLVLVPRETPFSPIHLENLLRVARAGGIILPAMPAFYHHPATVDDITDFVVGKILDSLGINHSLFRRWKGEDGD